jgi:hypothetical protein
VKKANGKRSNYPKNHNMRKLHHIGIPVSKAVTGETYHEDLKLWYTSSAASPNKLEFLRFDSGCPFPEIVKTTAHIAYEVPDLRAAMMGKKILYGPFTPSGGMDVVFIEEEGIPIELDFFY